VLATDRDSPNTTASPTGQPQPRAARPQQRGGADLHHGAGHRDLAHRQQVGQRKVQADAEHQQHHPDLGQLPGQRHVADKARRARPDHHPGQQIAHQGRHAQARGDQAQHQRQPETGGEEGDEGDVVGHRTGLSADRRCFIKAIGRQGADRNAICLVTAQAPEK
jgi:hypothetical protein